ncbi:cobyric acid synthase [Nocardia caishijiensis]|uniref:Cobyric acid synthase n=1 Tax=Nocardia caishijiensis TaxID=184756 RepID=A0ABQ6YPX5_9NOCA|nr:cobyric acid synthase [Nocardia caishijiensis]KAF0847791.1 adenosylcobyric acid synthase (glutamine-hydrolysing) [Nocardia caishijiensis]
MSGALRGALLIAGTTSDAGKSVVVAGICRMLARRGVRVAPFKAQNMSNNSVVTLDGGEIGRAQALQARACGLEPSVRFNPVLLKPGSDRRSQLVVRGKAIGTVGARDYFTRRQQLREVVADELASLRAEFDVVICEGAGSPAEINLRATDLANMGLARAADLPVLLVGDIDRGGVLAHLFGTVAVLEPEDQQLISGFIVNKFRGDVSLLQPGIDQLTGLTGRPTLGVLPFADDLWLDAEDSLGTVAGTPVGRPAPPHGTDWLTVAAIRLPRISNSTDIEALACEPGVSVHWADSPHQLTSADLVVVPGSKSTISDLEWLRAKGLGEALCTRAAAGRPILGICGGYQMLGRRIVDGVEHVDTEHGSLPTVVDGLGLLDLDIEFADPKIAQQVTGAAGEHAVHGYEIHHGRVHRTGDPAWLTIAGAPEGSAQEAIWGTHVHGVLESDEFRRGWLTEVAHRAGRPEFVVAPATSVASVREAQLDLLADLIEKNLDLAALETLIREGSSGGAVIRTATIGSN